MPMFGSVCMDCVCLVTNPTRRWMVASMRLGSIWLIRVRRAGSKCPVLAGKPVPADAAAAVLADAAAAGPASDAIGAATAVAAEAERKTRRLGPFEPDKESVSMP